MNDDDAAIRQATEGHAGRPQGRQQPGSDDIDTAIRQATEDQERAMRRIGALSSLKNSRLAANAPEHYVGVVILVVDPKFTANPRGLHAVRRNTGEWAWLWLDGPVMEAREGSWGSLLRTITGEGRYPTHYTWLRAGEVVTL